LLAAIALLVAPRPFDAQTEQYPSPRLATADLAFVDVNVVPMDTRRVLRHQTVLIEGDRITALGPADEIEVPARATIVQGDGRYLMPGLADMHVHLEREDLRAYVDHGITTVRNMWGFPDVQAMQREIASGKLLGPTIHSISPGLDGTPPKWPLTQLVLEPSQADSVVGVQYDSGWRTLKLYQDLHRDVYNAIVVAARARGMDYVGHVPTRVGLTHVLDSGQRSIEHLGGYARELGGAGGWWMSIDEDRLPFVVAQTREASAWNCPTLAIFAEIAKRRPRDVADQQIANRGRVVRALHDGGARLLIGTDSGIDIVTPGSSIHDELAQFAATGLSPYEVLRIATVDAADFLGGANDFGTIAVGRRADLLLVDSNPLDDVGALRTLGGVVLRGGWRPTPAR
jgi:imidazolonepropionase-like amidohydrolase